MSKLQIAKVFPRAGATEAKKSGFFFSNEKENIIRVAISHGIKQQLILSSVEKWDEELPLNRLMVEINTKAKTCKTVCAFIRENALFYAFNHDCGLAILRGGCNLVFQTPNNSKFSVFTGHRSYEPYITSGVLPVEKGDKIILYSGSFDKIIQKSDFYKVLSNKHFEKLIDEIVEKELGRKEKSILIFSL